MSYNPKIVQEIIKKLDTFREAKEWSDFMTSLTALGKILTSEKKNMDIFALPIIQLNKRLSQSLNPALPPGIHYKAIQIYSILIEKLRFYISNLKESEKKEFERNKTNKIFSLLLSGVFAFSASLRIQTRPAYFALFNDQILKLDICLDEHLRNILLGLLSGLDEDVDIAKKTEDCICRLYEAVNKKCFWNHLLNIFLSLPEQRIYVINFILKNTKIVDDWKAHAKASQDKPNVESKDGASRNKTIFYFLDERYICASLTSGLKSKDPIVQRGTLDIIKLLFEYDDFDKKSQLDLMYEFAHIYSTRDAGLIKRIETFIDKNGKYIKIIDQLDLALKINMGPQKEDDTPYLTLTEGFKMRLQNGIDDFLIYLKAMIYIEEKGDINDYFDNVLFISSLYELYKQRDHVSIDTLIDKFDILLAQMDIWSISFLIYNHANKVLKDKSSLEGCIDDTDVFIYVMMYFLRKTKIMKDNLYNVHLSVLVLLLLKDYQKIDFSILTEFLVHTLDYLPDNSCNEQISIDQVYSITVESYNLEDEKNLKKLYDNSRSILICEFLVILKRDGNLHDKLKILYKIISIFDNEILDNEVCTSIYNQLCICVINNECDDSLIELSYNIYKCVQRETIVKSIKDGGNDLYALLLQVKRHEALYAFNKIFERNFETFLIDDFLDGKEHENIYAFLQYVLNYKSSCHFYNAFIVIVTHQKNITHEMAYKSEQYDLDKIKIFFSGILNPSNIFRFTVNLILTSNISFVNFEYSNEVNVQQVVCGMSILNYMISNSISFETFLANKNNFINLENLPKHLMDKSPKVCLYNILVQSLCINLYEIQIETINLINLLIGKEIVDVDIILQSHDPKFIAFLDQIKHQTLFIRCYPILTALFNAGNEELQNNILGVFEKMDCATDISYDHINSVYKFENCAIKMKILLMILTKTENIHIKYKIFKYLKNKPDFCDKIHLYTVVNNIVEKLIKEHEKLDLSNTNAVIETIDSRNTDLLKKIATHLFEENTSMYIDCILNIKENCNFFRQTSQKLKIYEYMYKRLSLVTIQFLMIFEQNLSISEIVETFTANLPLVTSFYTGKKNKLSLTNYYIWLNKIMVIESSVITQNIDFMNKNFEMMNLVLLKSSDYSAKQMSADDRHNNIINLIRSIEKVIPYYKAERHRIGLQNYFTSIFFALKSNNIEQQSTALECLESLSYDIKLQKYWKKEYTDYMMEPSFFALTRQNFSHQMKITEQLFVNNPYRVGVLIDKFKVSGFFTSKDIEINQRIIILKRLAFVLMSTPRDSLVHALPQILEWLVEFINYGGNTIKLYSYFCAQYLFFKTDPNRISIIWPTIIADILAMFEDITNKGITKDEYPLLMQMLKFLEVIFNMDIDFTIEIKWGCIQPHHMENETKAVKFYFDEVYNELSKVNKTVTSGAANFDPSDKRILLKGVDVKKVGDFVRTLGNLTQYHQIIDISKQKTNDRDLERDLIDEFLQFGNEQNSV